MKAYAIEGSDQPASVVDLPDPDVGNRDVLVSIRAASVNGFDIYQASGYLIGMMEHRFPTVIGRDLAGVVEATGMEVTDFAVGDEVFGFAPSVPPLAKGTFAERVAGSDLVLAPKPPELDFAYAAALPLAGSAALDLLSAAKVGQGDTVLIVGATGGVGHFAVQLAVRRGATVIATAPPDDEAFVRELGATHVVDHTAGNIVTAVRSIYPDGITTLIDVVSQGVALTDSGSVVRSGGRVASLLGAADVDHFDGRGVQAENVNAAPTVEKLQLLATMATTGELKVVVHGLYSLDQVEEALDIFRQGKRGKLVIQM
jgi:NADPH:quinone reductase-like Zn-dependent oxidoreductase